MAESAAHKGHMRCRVAQRAARHLSALDAEMGGGARLKMMPCQFGQATDLQNIFQSLKPRNRAGKHSLLVFNNDKCSCSIFCRNDTARR